MAAFDIRQLFQRTIIELRQSGVPRVKYKELLHKVTHDHKDVQDDIALFFDAEVRAGRLIVNGHDEERVVSLDPIAVASYVGQDAAAPSGATANLQGPLSKSEAQMDYIRSARIMRQILHALEGHEPEALLRDVDNLPTLIQSNLETVAYLEDLNKNLAEDITASNDRIEHLEERIKQTYGAFDPPQM
ncbi:hypothetical protein NUW54_g3559 [Trametes sanguinea]|uniref:Uncharacterized protein n=1 Tax=Trametes sanguinea TaxID=158606 RepID=A0ACC1Q0Y9_9APHY|nr:hypothetical protein NUW54_g3559 [Trametes sanguinea]